MRYCGLLRTWAAALVMLLTLPIASQLSAQMLPGTTSAPTTDATVTLPDPLTPEAATELLSRLSDADVRALLLEQLNTQAAETEGDDEAAVNDFLYHATTGAVRTVTLPVERLPLLVSEQGRAFATFYEKIGGGSGLLSLLFYMFVVFGAATVAELIFRRLTRDWRILPPADPDNITLRETVQLLVQRLTTQVDGFA